MVNTAIDTDRWNKSSDGNYQDDALYIGYSKANIADTDPIASTTAWTKGGVIRLLTKEDANPANWSVSKVISEIGPVTTGIARLQDRKNKKLWLFFGTGRFYYGGDDASSQRHIMGVQDRCYTTSDTLDRNCAVTTASGDNPEATGKGGALALTDLQPQTTSISTTLPSGMKGWYIALDGEDVTALMGAERSITDAVALTNGGVFFTTFKPTSDVCQFGGNSFLWGVKYDTGGVAPAAALTGKVLVQVSTGAFEEVNLSTALTAAGGRKMGTAMTGKPPTDAPPVISNAGNKPVKKILHMQEK
jgi:type IV pilus assembly protein PilY1